MTIYLDIILLENVCMNYIILYTTGFLLKQKMKPLYLLIASLIGSIYAVLSYIKANMLIENSILKIILSITMTYIAFHPKHIKLLGKELIMFYFISFVFGGCAFALLYFLKPQDILIRNGVFVGTYPMKIGILAAMIGFVVTGIGIKIARRKTGKKDWICTVKIHFEFKSIKIKAFVDSGNMLKDPITGTPVIVVEKNSLKGLFVDNILDDIDEILGGEKVVKEPYITKFRVIPFTSLGKQNGMLLGFRPDYVIVEQNDTENEIKNVMIGIYDKSLTRNGTYTALIGLELLEGSEEHELITSFKE